MARTPHRIRGDDQARAVIEWLQRFGRYHPVLTDAAIAAGVALIGVPSLRHHQQWGIALTVALCLPLVLRRRYPRAVFAAITLVLLVQWLIDVQLGADLALLVSLYTVAAVSSRRWTAAAVGVAEVGAVLATLRWGDPVLPVLRRPLGAGDRVGPARHQRPEPAGACLASLQGTGRAPRGSSATSGAVVAAAAERARIARRRCTTSSPTTWPW